MRRQADLFIGINQVYPELLAEIHLLLILKKTKSLFNPNEFLRLNHGCVAGKIYSICNATFFRTIYYSTEKFIDIDSQFPEGTVGEGSYIVPDIYGRYLMSSLQGECRYLPVTPGSRIKITQPPDHIRSHVGYYFFPHMLPSVSL